MHDDASEPPVQEALGADGILRLTLNDSPRRNALSAAMLARLATCFERAESDASVRVIVLAAHGPAFCAGHDLKELTAARQTEDRGRGAFVEILRRCAELMQAIVHHRKPVIAEIAGVATAAGCQLVASCDLAYATPSARFAVPGVNIGLFCSTPMVALSRSVPNKAAMEMLLTGDLIAAEQAAAIGLINRVVPAGQLTDTVMALAGRIAARSSVTLAYGKQTFYRQKELPLAEAYAYTAAVMVDNMLDRDAEEGIAAFLEKRAPRWSDGTDAPP
jgi:enoyl-CoA hydratase/carnithine racemase